MMIEELLVAGFGAIVCGALMLGVLRSDSKAHGQAIEKQGAAIRALHARFDAIVIALARHNVIDSGAMMHIARRQPREEAG